jgi:hypothetical protein
MPMALGDAIANIVGITASIVGFCRNTEEFGHAPE